MPSGRTSGGLKKKEKEGEQAGEKGVQTSAKGPKWFDQIDEFDMTTHASFISFAIQCLMSVQKWESMVDISNRLNSATENTFASQLLPFIITIQHDICLTVFTLPYL